MGFAAISCKKKTEGTPVPRDFTVHYDFNNEGDAELKKVILDTYTFYPPEGGYLANSHWQNYLNTYENILPNQKIAHDFPEPWMKKILYPGCVTSMTVTLFFDRPVYSSLPSRLNKMRKAYELDNDTVTAAADCTRVFSWPSDTLLYQEVY